MRYASLSHSKWECKYHVVFIPKGRKKELYGKIREVLGPVFHKLARQKRSQIEAGHMRMDHVHMLISIPPKVCGSRSDRVYQGQECDSNSTTV